MMGYESEGPSEAPTKVRAVPRLSHDLAALRQLTRHTKPPNVLVRPVDGMAVVFIYGDASGAGYGISLWKKGAAEIGVEYGEWTKEFSEKSSNHREMYNFTLFLEQSLAHGKFTRGTEIFMFTEPGPWEVYERNRNLYVYGQPSNGERVL